MGDSFPVSALNHSPEATLGEELAGPAVATPVARVERIPILDVIRGFAVLGILLMNITGFSGPSDLDHNPIAVGHHNTLNIGFWMVRIVLFEGKMRAVFSMLFGAGVILLTDRAEVRGLGARIGDIFARRNMWLMVFGMLHAYFLWFGDILYWYGLVALLFLYPFRKAKPRLLFIAGATALLLVEVPMTLPLFEELPQAKLLSAAQAAQHAGKPLTKQQSEALDRERASAEDSKKERNEDLRHMRGGYWEIVKFRAKQVRFLETDFLYFFGFGDLLGMMLIGMALLRTGFLSGSMPDRIYLRTAVICYFISVAVMGFSVTKVADAHFAKIAADLYFMVPYEAVRLIGALANISVVILVCKRGWLKPLTRRLAAAGQIAFSNYILTSVLCSLFFNGYGLNRYGQMEYYQLFYVVAVVWVVILTVSPIWLRHFQFGPLEWLWRSLTYWKRQPMRLRPVSLPFDQLAQPTPVA